MGNLSNFLLQSHVIKLAKQLLFMQKNSKVMDHLIAKNTL